MIKSRDLSRVILLSVVSAFLLLSAGIVFGADITVDDDCSVYNAFLSANGEEQVAPLDNCEAGDDDETGPDTITIDLASTDEGTIVLSSAMSVSSDIVVEGGGFVLSGDETHQVFVIDGGSLQVNSLTMTSGYADGDGGAISVSSSSLTLNNSVVSNSIANGNGGGIYAVDSDVSLISSAISGNSNAEESAGAGGGIYFAGADSNSLSIDSSGFDTNTSTGDGGGAYLASGTATISNSTFGENTATSSGGGIYNAGAAILTHITVKDNSAETGGGLLDDSLIQLYNSILSGNTGGDCSGTLNANLGNLIQDQSCGHDENNEDPLLLKLAGLPIYYTMQSNSPAIDSASADYCLSVDQRGLERPEGACDIGAAEYERGAFSFQIQSAQVSAAATSTADTTSTSPTAIPTAATPTCETLPAGVTVTGYVSGTQCQQRDAGGIGNQTIVDYGFKTAIDIWGYVPGSGVTICFQDTGVIILLDAATSPRAIVSLQTYADGDKRCAHVDREGTAILMPSAFMSTGEVSDLELSLSGCTVTTTDILNLRNAPAGDTVLAVILNDVSFNAQARTSSWFQVDYFGTVGWISGDYVTTAGTCQ